MVESTQGTAERLPVLGPSTAVTGRYPPRCGEPALAHGLVDIDIQGPVAAVWATALPGVSEKMFWTAGRVSEELSPIGDSFIIF